MQASLVGAAGALRPAAAQSPAPTAAERARLARLAGDIMDWCDAPGLSVAIARRGEDAYVEAFGFADKEKQETLTTRHRFRIASVTKPITAAGVLLLVEAGKLRLSDRVFGPDSLLGDDYKTPAGRQDIEAIVINHLLTHSCGGWSNDRSDPMFANAAMSHRELIDWTLENQPLTDAPGRRYAYSNFGYCLLGRVIEKATGLPYRQYIAESVLKQAGISDMQIAGNTLAERAPDEVKYYGQDDDPYGMNVARMDSHGGWIATPSDLVRFFLSIDGFRSKQLLRPETLDIMTTPSATNPHYAKGLFVNRLNNWWHTGVLPGTASIAVRAHSDFCWAALVNTRSRLDDMTVILDSLMWRMIGSVDAWKPA